MYNIQLWKSLKVSWGAMDSKVLVWNQFLCFDEQKPALGQESGSRVAPLLLLTRKKKATSGLRQGYLGKTMSTTLQRLLKCKMQKHGSKKAAVVCQGGKLSFLCYVLQQRHKTNWRELCARTEAYDKARYSSELWIRMRGSILVSLCQ